MSMRGAVSFETITPPIIPTAMAVTIRHVVDKPLKIVPEAMPDVKMDSPIERISPKNFPSTRGTITM